MENEEITTTNVDIEALTAQLNEAEEKNKTLWDKIYKLKKEKKETPTETAWFSESDFNRLSAERDFYSSNPSLNEHKDTINNLTSWGLSLEEAKTVLERRDPTIAQRAVTNQSNFTAWDIWTQTTTYTQEETAKLSPSEYKKMWALKTAGKVKII